MSSLHAYIGAVAPIVQVPVGICITSSISYSMQVAVDSMQVAARVHVLTHLRRVSLKSNRGFNPYIE